MTQVADLPAQAQPGAWSPHIVALVCNWCTYTGADMAGTLRLDYPDNVRMLRVPCTGRVSPLFILKAFEGGADGVIVSGCHPGDCHYVQGNYVARRRFTALRTITEFVGIDPRRLQFAWVSASEGAKWAKLVGEVTETIREVGQFNPAEIKSKSFSLPELPAPPRSAPAAEATEKTAAHLRSFAKRLLEEAKAAVFIGYGEADEGGTKPAFIRKPEEADGLRWGAKSFANLAAYLPRFRDKSEKIAVVVKRCDAKSVVNLLQESQIKRENLTLIGATCTGVGEDGKLQPKCYSCSGGVSPHCDFTVDAEGVHEGAINAKQEAPVAADPRDAQIAYLDGLAPEERWSFWQAEFAKCIRCYGCRAVCPQCYCTTCIADKHQPQWITPGASEKGNTAWNVIRALHLAGRCAGCDECARVCPARLPLDLINLRVSREIEEVWGYRAGEDPKAAPPLATFKPDDPQDFIR